MTKDDISPMPTPYSEEPQLVPGGVDAIEDDPADNGLSRDLNPDDNPAVDDVLPDAVSDPDDKSQAPDGDTTDSEAGTTSEDVDAGEEAEDGSVEPPE
jgi:hypothetical protein